MILYNTIKMNHAVERQRAHGKPVNEADLERRSPLQHERINLHGRYNFDHSTYTNRNPTNGCRIGGIGR